MSFLDDCEEGRRLRSVAAKAASRLKSPMLLALFEFWRLETRGGREEEEEAPAPGDGGVCFAIARCLKWAPPKHIAES